MDVLDTWSVRIAEEIAPVPPRRPHRPAALAGILGGRLPDLVARDDPRFLVLGA